MVVGSLFRRVAWTGLDLIKGRPVARHVRDIAARFEEPDAARARARSRLKALIEHACATTEHYGGFVGARDLDDFPVLQKRQIGEDYASFLSSAYSRDTLFPVTTGGSYGTPLAFLLTREKKARRLAEVIYFSRWCGYRVGDRHALTTSRLGKKSRWRLFLQNEVLMNPILLDGAWLEEARELLLEDCIEVIIGYPSAIGAVASYCRSLGDDAKDFGSLRSVITMAETLEPATRDLIKHVFGCQVRSRYATTEFGVLAQECERGNHHVNTASYVLELLSLRGADAAASGDLGRVVVTDLFSYAMPLIRYDTGDLATGGESCPCGREGPVLTALHGRTIEQIIDAQGRRVFHFALTTQMKGIDGILQYQIAQTGPKSYEVRLCSLPSFRGEAELRRRIVPLLGDEAEFSVRILPQIPPLPSGKRPYVVNEWLQRLSS